MRCVVYDPEDLEALTVIDVPQQFIRELEQGKRGPLLRFPIQEPMRFTPWANADDLNFTFRIAEVLMERFQRNGVFTWVALALNPEICLLMRSELLPGQRRDDLERQKKAFLNGFFAAVGA